MGLIKAIVELIIGLGALAVFFALGVIIFLLFVWVIPFVFIGGIAAFILIGIVYGVYTEIAKRAKQ